MRNFEPIRKPLAALALAAVLFGFRIGSSHCPMGGARGRNECIAPAIQRRGSNMIQFLAKSTHQLGALGCRRAFPRHLLSRITTLAFAACTALFAQTFCSKPLLAESTDRPNIIFIMADDLGYGDLGCYGQDVIETPHIDKLAEQGTRFTQAYAGSTVCAPSRSVLMTGQHTGHTTVRGNFGKGGVKGLGGGSGRVPLKAADVTVAEVLKD